MKTLKEQYNKEIISAMQKDFGFTNKMAVPKVEKVVINVGVGSGLKDKEFIESVKKTLIGITGQKPVEAAARKSISNFKIREGMIVGVKVTLRGARMWDFLDKLVKVTFPRIRDFRGLEPKGFDKQGNYSVGFKEYVAFPEIDQDEVERLHGLEICVNTSAQSEAEGRALLTHLGFPFKKENK
jgi:large subunit ribosomal protein L5